MAEFQFDTSGLVPGMTRNRHGELAGSTCWSDLSPFVQGYVEAMARISGAIPFGYTGGVIVVAFAFSDLAPETLARILEDCAKWDAMFGDMNVRPERFWKERQTGHCPSFPPLTLTLCDDGKVRFQ